MQNILNKNWENFKGAFGEKKEIDLFLKQLGDFRNSNAHGRELLTYQKHLAIGLSGEIRNRITKFRSMQDTGESYFPRIESVHDNYGNSWKIGDYNIETKLTLRVGDRLEFVISATDPQDEKLFYSINGPDEWQENNHLHFTLTDKEIRREMLFGIYVKSSRSYHAKRDYDDAVIFCYQVLPISPG
ncbi:hypothetical protein ACFQT0_25040 [Hymenobacter humi]|uniref:Swt1-like HEPN domain-containing protein n=1 Tax=Hymenobacter humi TaxID=1411620 RepID=A0ABW2U9S0_9BACT